MKTFITRTIATIALSVAAVTAQAQTMFLDRPFFMMDNFPPSILCAYRESIQLYNCILPVEKQVAGIKNLSFIDTTSKRMFTEQYKAQATATCKGGICSDDTFGDLIGYITNTKGWTDTYNVWLPMGYYLHEHDNGETRAHRWGTGPRADENPAPPIYRELASTPQAYQAVLVSGTTSHSQAPKTYDAVCTPGEQLCAVEVDGQYIGLYRYELPEYIPMATDTYLCENEFCFDEDYQVIGLNPDSPEWE